MTEATQNKPSMLKRFMPLIIFLLLVILLVIGLDRAKDVRLVPSPLIGKPVPEFELPFLDKPGTFSQEDLKGQVTLLNVWASWCFACRQEHDVVTQLSQQGFRVIGFNYKDESSDATAWLRQFGNPYRAVIQDIDGRVGIDWGVYGAPETFLVDERGIIRHKVIGPLSDRDKLKALMDTIKELPGVKS
jgi:cytochrome c biogenesis protein CcmG/thiol:disulfide interchange protein DsbE